MSTNEELQCGLKITPPKLVFKDAEKGNKNKIDITIQNFSKKAKSVRLRGPETENFVLRAPSEEQLLPSGLVINATLQFTCNEEGRYEDNIVVFVDNNTVTLPIFVYPPRPVLEFKTPLSFGISIPDGLVLTRHVDITNNGKRAGNFRIDYGGDQPIKIFPCVGTIEPGSFRSIKIEFTSSALGTWEEVAGVELEGTGYTELRMYGEVRPSALMLLNISGTGHLELIKFGTTLFGCEKFQPAVLFNNGPTSLGFAIVLEEGGEGEEVKTIGSEGNPRAQSQSITSLITASPNQGGIGPYEKVVINFCFHPSLSLLPTGWEREVDRAGMKEFVLFMHIVPITTIPSGRMIIDALYVKQNQLTPLVEIGVTGRAMDVDVDVLPFKNFDLGTCELGTTVQSIVTLQNNNTLPLAYQFTRIAHFHTLPMSGKLGAGKSVEVVLSFVPSQFGSFSKKIKLQILGVGNYITDSSNSEGKEPSIIAHGKMKVLKETCIQVKGVCKVTEGKFMTEKALALTKQLEDLEITYAKKTTHFDLYGSIRPSNDLKKQVTTFTKQQRYTYVDPDYAYTEEEEESRQEHKDKYKNYIDGLRNLRVGEIKRSAPRSHREEKQFDSEEDIGMKPAAGLFPPEVTKNNKETPSEPQHIHDKVLTTLELASRQATVGDMSVANNIINSTPITVVEKNDCSKRLTPQQMHQIVIGPAVIEFGDVSLRTLNSKPLMIVNHLPIHIFIEVDIDCRELRQSLPLTQVIPPNSMSKVDIVFESQKTGPFQRSVVYTVNNHIKQHINVHANIVTPCLALSHTSLLLTPIIGIPHEDGCSGVVTVTNKTNGPAEFSWQPDKICPFAIRPSQGCIEPHGSLNCEVLYFPTVDSPLDGSFVLDVVEGNRLNLACHAEFPSTTVQFTERRLTVGTLPLHVLHRVKAGIRNTGYHHAYFQVLNTRPTPFCTIKPESGCLPVGSICSLELTFFAVDVEKFDFKVDVKIRGNKKITLRVGGSVEPPLIECDVGTFAFHGVHVGATVSQQFILFNPMSTEAEVEYNLSKFKDFELVLPNRNFADDDKKNYSKDNIHYVYMSPGEKVKITLKFSPKQVASYDFALPVLINDMIAPPPPMGKIPGTRSASVMSQPLMASPCRRVTATAMFPILDIDKLNLSFSKNPYTLDLTTPPPTPVQGFTFANKGTEDASFLLDLSDYPEVFDQGVFRFTDMKGLPIDPPLREVGVEKWGTLEPGEAMFIGVEFSPSTYCDYSLEIPVMLKGVTHYPYRILSLTGLLKSPSLSFSTNEVVLSPIPLQITATAVILLTATNYTCPLQIDIQIPKINADDGSEITPLSVKVENNPLSPCTKSNPSQTTNVVITFTSQTPVTFKTELLFTDGTGNKYPLSITATADNCLLTNYPYISAHPRHHLPDPPTGTSDSDVFQQYSPPTATPSTVSLASVHQLSGGTESGVTYTPHSLPSHRDGARNAFRAYITPMKTHCLKEKCVEGEEEEELEGEQEQFLHTVLCAAQRWVSHLGWPNQPNPVMIPDTITNIVLLKKGTVTAQAGKMRSVFELVQHLCGRPIPGIPVNPPLATNAQERVKLLHWQLCTMLTFLRVQGAKLSHINAEWLLSPNDYLLWAHLSNYEASLPTQPEDVLLNLHNKYASQAWIDLILQLAKVFVLVKVRPSKDLTVSPDSYKSSVYSTQERTILAWLSHHYQTQRSVIWPANPPSTRWIVCFDYDMVDGLVLACMLAAHCPFLIKTHFQDMYLKVSSPEECFHNALSVVHALRSIGIDYDVQPSDILQPNAVAMLLLCTHLYIYLPHYKPKTTVLFEGALHQSIKKELKIENPSTKAISYSISIIGPDGNEFSASPKSLQIGGHSSGIISITFMSCWLHPCHAMLMLVSRRTGSACGTTLLFQLESVVNDIYPVSTVAVETPVYNTYKIPLTVTNPLTMGGTFKVILVESRGSPDNDKFTRMKGFTPDKPRSRKSKKDDSSDTFYDPRKASVPHHSPCAFWCGDSSIQLSAAGTATLNIHFLPLSPGPRHCALLFSCPGVGEFLQSIGGIGLLPEPLPLPPCKGPSAVRISSAVASRRQQMIGTGSDTVARFRCDPETSLEEHLLIPVDNYQKREALIKAAQYRMSDIEIRRRKLTGTLASASLASLDFMKHGQQLSQDTASDTTSVKYSDDLYEVHIDSKYFTFPPTIEIPKNADSGGVNLTFKFKPDGQGFYPAKLLLVSSWDIRMYELEVTVTPSTTDAEIIFSAPTLQSITQDIPIINETQHDWNLSAEIEGDMYYGPPVVVAKAGCTTLYPLMFKPLHQGSLEGKLTLTNVANGTVHQFRLVGTGLKPLPQETVILTCHARQRASHTVYVHNPSERRKTFQAYTDLDCIVGNDEIVIEGGISVPYEIIAFPRRQGHYKGSFSFESVSVLGDKEKETGSVCSGSSEGHSVWYSVEVLADAPPPENTIDLLCEARKALTLELGIANPTDGVVEFDVTCEGEGLSGPSTVTVGPRAEASYKLLYSPTFIGTSTGKVTFLNTELGEFWYGLRLSAERPRPNPLPDMRAELGRSCSEVFTVRNNNTKSSVVTITLSNTKHFILHSQNKVAVPGKGQVDLKLTFIPSSLELGGSQTCLIEFSSPQLGEWSHTVNGQGLRPTVMDPMVVECPLGQSMQTILPFRNPLDKSITIKASLLEKNKVDGKKRSDTLFALLCTNDEIEVAPKGVLELPFSFAPLNMLLGAAHIMVEVFEEGPLDGIRWQFPIKGCPLFKPSSSYNTPTLTCRAKERIECFLECFVDTSTTKPAQSLPYPEASIRDEPSELRDGWKRSPALEEFDYEIKEDVGQSLSILLSSSYLISHPGLHLLNFAVIFVPGKSLKKNINLIVSSKSGGKWEFPLAVHSTDPIPDDVVVIRATGLHKDSVVGMRLNSLSSKPVAYDAYLSRDSDPDFRVYPATGQLLPEGTDGTLICVAYKPTLYGKTHKAKLIVQTPDNQWSYVIQGQSPAFSVPVGVATTPLARPPLKTPGKRKNFIRENLKLKQSSPSSPIKPIRPII